jgi:hypothetical protein
MLVVGASGTILGEHRFDEQTIGDVLLNQQMQGHKVEKAQ